MVRIPHCLDNRFIDGGKVVSLTHPPHSTPQEHYYFQATTNLTESLGRRSGRTVHQQKDNRTVIDRGIRARFLLGQEMSAIHYDDDDNDDGNP
jgi:hypothetical protein